MSKFRAGSASTTMCIGNICSWPLTRPCSDPPSRSTIRKRLRMIRAEKGKECVSQRCMPAISTLPFSWCRMNGTVCAAMKPTVHEGGVGVHVGANAPAAHLGDELHGAS